MCSARLPVITKKEKAFSHPKCGQVRSEMPSATLWAVDWLGLPHRMEAWIGAAAAAHSNSIRFVDNRDETGEVRPFATVTLYCLHRIDRFYHCFLCPVRHRCMLKFAPVAKHCCSRYPPSPSAACCFKT